MKKKICFRLIRSLPPQEPNAEVISFMAEIDELMKGSKEDHSRALNLLLSRAEDMASDPNFLWRLCKAYKLQHDTVSDKEAQLHFINLGKLIYS